MAWIYLFLAGLFEMGFAIAIKYMDSHRNIPWSTTFYVCIILSFGFLEQATKTIPLGTAYAVWTGVGGVGIAIVGMVYMGDPITAWRIFFLILLISALIGLKLTSGH